MAFTYVLTNDIGKVRFELSDTVSGSALFSDEEITYQLEESGSVLSAAADLCDILATRFASRYDFATDGQSFKRSQEAQAWADRAKALRLRASGNSALSMVDVERVDGYSERHDRIVAAGGCCGDTDCDCFETPC